MKKWSTKFDCCIKCKTTKQPHNSKGLCKKCSWRQFAKENKDRLETKVKCENCGKVFYKQNVEIERRPGGRHFCTQKCYLEHKKSEKITKFFITERALKGLNKQGISREKIAEFFGCHKSTIDRRMKKYGLNFPIIKNKINCHRCGNVIYRPKSEVYKTRYNFCGADCALLYKEETPNEYPMEGLKGKDNPNWRGGISAEPYCTEWLSKEYKNFIKERDMFKCMNPSCNKISGRLCIHHIDYDKKNCHPWNLVTLCTSCNSKANYKRETWKLFYKRMLYYTYDLLEIK